MNLNDIKLIIQNFKNIYENNISTKDLYSCEYNNPISIDIFTPIILRNYTELIAINRNTFVLNNIRLLYPLLKNLRVDLNRFGYLIQYFLYYNLLKSSTIDQTVNTDCLNLVDIFNNNDPNFTYINNLSQDLVLVDKIKNLKILDIKFNIITTQITIDTTVNYDLCSPINLFNEQVEIIIKHLEKIVSLINYLNTVGPISSIQNNENNVNNGITKNFLELCDDALKKKILNKKSDKLLINEKSEKSEKNTIKFKKIKIKKIIKILSKLNIFPVFIVIMLIFNLLKIGQCINNGYKK